MRLAAEMPAAPDAESHWIENDYAWDILKFEMSIPALVWLNHASLFEWLRRLKFFGAYADGGRPWRHRFHKTVTVKDGVPLDLWTPEEVPVTIIPQYLPEHYTSVDILRKQLMLGDKNEAIHHSMPQAPVEEPEG